MGHAAMRSYFARPSLAKRRTVRKVIRCQRGGARSRRILRFHLRRYRRAYRIRARWAYYKAHPMPTCTWLNESGVGPPEWAPSSRYYIWNSSGSGARGKYQIMAATWAANGGGVSWAPLEQERVARNVLASQGIGAWSGCG